MPVKSIENIILCDNEGGGGGHQLMLRAEQLLTLNRLILARGPSVRIK